MQRPVYPLAGTTYCAPHDACHIIDGKVQVVVEGQGQQVVARQAVKGRVKVEAVRPAAVRSGVAGEPGRVVEANHPPPAPTAHRPALVRHDCEEPRLQVRTGLEPLQLAPGLQGGVLHRVLGGCSIFQHGYGEAERRL